MSVTYGAQAAGIPGNAGGVAFGMTGRGIQQPGASPLASRGTSGGVLWHGGTIAPDIDLHHASVGVTSQHLNDAALASRKPTNPTPGPLVSQNSTFSQLPTAIQDAMRNLGNYPSLGGSSALNSMRSAVFNPALNDYLSQATLRLTQQNKQFEAQQKAQEEAAFKAQVAANEAMRPDYMSLKGLPTAPAINVPGTAVKQAPSLPLPTY